MRDVRGLSKADDYEGQRIVVEWGLQYDLLDRLLVDCLVGEDDPYTVNFLGRAYYLLLYKFRDFTVRPLFVL